MKKDNNIKEAFKNKFVNKDYPNWQTKVINKVDIEYVICNLLNDEFVVEIDGRKNDINFIKDSNNNINYITNNIKFNQSFRTSDILIKGLKEGVWYVVTEEELPQEEKDKILADIRKEEKRKLGNLISQRFKINN